MSGILSGRDRKGRCKVEKTYIDPATECIEKKMP